MNFSQRMGLEPTDLPLQINEMSKALRNSLWNYIYYITGDSLSSLWKSRSEQMYRFFFRQPIDDVPYHTDDCHDLMKSEFMSLSWNKVYDFIEVYLVIIDMAFRSDDWRRKEEYEEHESNLNAILSREFSGYRLIDSQFAPITDENELTAVRDALESTLSQYENVREHLKQAVTLLKQKPTPDYRNSIKESISAVEGLCKTLTEKKSGGIDSAMKELSKKIDMHEAMKQGFIKLYGYTSNEDGVRHSIMEQPNVGFAEAKYMLVTCSAFVNFIIIKIKTKD